MDLGKVTFLIFDDFLESFSLVSQTTRPNLREIISLKEIVVVLFFKQAANSLLKQRNH